MIIFISGNDNDVQEDNKCADVCGKRAKLLLSMIKIDAIFSCGKNKMKFYEAPKISLPSLENNFDDSSIRMDSNSINLMTVR